MSVYYYYYYYDKAAGMEIKLSKSCVLLCTTVLCFYTVFNIVYHVSGHQWPFAATLHK